MSDSLAIRNVMHRALEDSLERHYESVALHVAILTDEERQRLLWATNAVAQACREQGAHDEVVQARYRLHDLSQLPPIKSGGSFEIKHTDVVENG